MKVRSGLILQDAFSLFQTVMDTAHDQVEGERLLCVIHRNASLDCRRNNAFRDEENGPQELSKLGVLSNIDLL
jgi:hypothetical protein